MAVGSGDFYLILNDGGSNQYPQNEGFHITGDTYLVYNSSTDGTSSNYAKIVNFAEVSATNLQMNEGETGNSTITSAPSGLAFTYESSNTSVATVAADGTVTGTGGGNCTITVNWATQEVSGSHYIAGSTTFDVTVTETAKERTYVKVTTTEDIENGKKYLIVYEKGNLAFDGSRSTLNATNNYKSVTISDNAITTSENIYFTIDNGTILSASGKYIGSNSDTNGMDESTSAISNTISISDGNVIIKGSGGAYLRYNSSSSLFRYYKSATYTNQQAIQLYKEGSVNQEVKIYVKADSAPYIYTWTGDGASATRYTGDWPGTQATQTEVVNGITWYTMTVPTKGFNLILDNGNSGDSNQTANINNITGDTYFVWNSSADGYGAANQYLEVDFAEVIAENKTVREGNSIASSVTTQPEGLVLSYESSNTSIASVTSNGIITGEAQGTATITATWATQVVDGQGYLGGSTTFTVTVTPAPSGNVFVKALSEDELVEGMQVIIVNDTYNNVMGAQGDNNFSASSVSIDKDTNPYEATLDAESTSTILTLEGSSGAWYFKDENEKYLYAASSNSNYLRTQENKDDNSKAAITISGSNSDAAIVFQGSNTRNTIKYNGSSNGAGLFSCYANNQKAVQIYYRSAQTIIAKPTITPVSGTYTEAQMVTITNNAEGATVYYTTDGSTPTAESTAYTAPFRLSQNGTYTIKAIAISSDGKSSVTTNTITINIFVEAPTITPADGSQIDESTDISIAGTTGTTIYYTTDGTDPVKDGALTGTAKAYSGTFNMTKAGTVKAVTMNSDGVFSETTSATYTYNGTVTLPYYERFDAGLGNFITIGTGKLAWEYREHTSNDFVQKYGEIRKYAYCSRKSTETTKTGLARFISPILDLTEEGLTNVLFNFIHAGNYFTDENLRNTCRVQFISDENGKAITDESVLSDDTNWTDITIPDDGWFESNSQFPRKNSGDIDLSGCIGHKIRICFLFDASSTSNYGTWNVDQISVRGELVEKVDIVQPNGATGEGYTTYVTKNDIDVATTLSVKNTKLYKVIEFDAKNVVIVQLGLGTGTNGDKTYSETLIPAETPILVKGDFGERELVLANSSEVIPKPKGNLLRSAVEGVTATANDRIFVLQYPKSVGAYGFHLLGKNRTLSGRKAYLNGVDEVEELTTETNSKTGVFFFGAETDVDIVVTDIGKMPSSRELPEGIYDLTGRKMTGAQLPKGIYVVKGRKFVVK